MNATPGAVRIGRWAASLLLAAALMATVAAAVGAGTQPAAGASEPRLLVAADLRGHALLVFDPARPASARRIPLPGGPHELGLLPDGRVVTSLEQAGALAIVDLGRGAVEVVTVGGFPHGLAIADGVIAFTDRDRDQVRRLRIEDWVELEPTPAGRWPHAVAVLVSGGLVVANAAEDSLTIDGHTAAVGAMPETVAVSPRGDRVATAAAMGDAVELLSTDGAALARAEVGGRPVRVLFSPSGDLVAAALSAGAGVALVDAKGAVRRVPVGGLPDGLAFDDGGRLLYVSDLTTDRVVVVDVASARIEATYHGAGESTGALLLVPARSGLGGPLSPLVRQ